MIIIPTKWLFHWEYTQHFQTNPYSESKPISATPALAEAGTLYHCGCKGPWR